MAIIHGKLCYSAPPVKKWKILLEQSFAVHMPLLTATSAFRLGRRILLSGVTYTTSIPWFALSTAVEISAKCLYVCMCRKAWGLYPATD